MPALSKKAVLTSAAIAVVVAVACFLSFSWLRIATFTNFNHRNAIVISELSGGHIPYREVKGPLHEWLRAQGFAPTARPNGAVWSPWDEEYWYQRTYGKTAVYVYVRAIRETPHFLVLVYFPKNFEPEHILVVKAVEDWWERFRNSKRFQQENLQ